LHMYSRMRTARFESAFERFARALCCMVLRGYEQSLPAKGRGSAPLQSPDLSGLFLFENIEWLRYNFLTFKPSTL